MCAVLLLLQSFTADAELQRKGWPVLDATEDFVFLTTSGDDRGETDPESESDDEKHVASLLLTGVPLSWNRLLS